MTRPTAVVAYCLLGTGCAVPPEPADLVVIHGTIATMDPERPRAEALAIRGDRIVAVGETAEIEVMVAAGRTTVVDAAGGTVIPGYNDAHIHLRPIDLDFVDLRYVSHPAEITRRVAARTKAAARDDELIVGGGWDHELFPDRQWPTRAILDSVAPGHPVLLIRVDGHSALVNGVMLRHAGIGPTTPDPPGGRIVRDPRTGQATGVLQETALQLIDTTGLGRSRSASEQREYERAGWRAMFDSLLSHGVTSAQVPALDTGSFGRLASLHRDGELRVRVSVGMPLPEDTLRLDHYVELQRRYPRSGDWLRFGFLKGFTDGSMSSSTAFLFEPFSDAPDTRGLPQMAYAELERRVVAADRRGLQIGLHAIGDRGIAWALDAFAAAQRINGRRDARHRIEHASIVRLADLPRFGALGVIVSTQPVFVRTDNLYAEQRVGPERSKGVYPWRRFLDAGARVAFSTDWWVEPIDPREGLYAALTRKDRRGRPEGGWFPDQNLRLEEAIRLYTLGSAFAEAAEARKGRLVDGALADLVVYDRDLFHVGAPEQILDALVAVTVVGGRVAYRSDGR